MSSIVVMILFAVLVTYVGLPESALLVVAIYLYTGAVSALNLFFLMLVAFGSKESLKEIQTLVLSKSNELQIYPTVGFAVSVVCMIIFFYHSLYFFTAYATVSMLTAKAYLMFYQERFVD